FSNTDINFQRVPLVDTSNPFMVREIPKPEESLVVVHYNDHSRLQANFDLLISRLHGAFQSHPQTLVVPGPMMESAMALILKPAIEKLMHQRRESRARQRL
ncbi:MAG: phosphoribulokinase, plasmid, partial [Stenotrophobium sp.]